MLDRDHTNPGRNASDVSIGGSPAPDHAMPDSGRDATAHGLSNDELCAILDQLGIGIAVVDRACNVRYANRQAANLLASAEALKQVDGRICAMSSAESEQLRAAVARACFRADTRVDTVESLALKSRQRDAKWPLVVCPGPRAPGRTGQVPVSQALLLFTEPRLARSCISATVNQLYRLTGAEARVVEGILDGLALKRIAAKHDVAVHTVRTQLNSIFAKVGVNRQAELVRTMFMVPPAGSGPCAG